MAPPEYAALTGPKRLGDRLLEAGLITRTQLDEALDRQQAATTARPRLGRALVDLGVLGEHDLTRMLSVHFALPAAPFALADADAHAVQRIPAAMARRHRVLPFRVVGGSLVVAVADAIGAAALDELALASGLTIVPYLTSEVALDAALPADEPAGHANILATRLRELATRLQQLADSYDQPALSESDDAWLHDELERVRASLGVLAAALRDARDRPRPHDAVA